MEVCAVSDQNHVLPVPENVEEMCILGIVAANPHRM